MSIRRSLSGVLALALGMTILPQTAEAQRLLERVRRAATQIAAEEAMQYGDALIGDVITRAVEDGRFMALASPWTAGDGASVVSRGTITGRALVARQGNTFGILLCDDSQSEGWTARIAVTNASAARGAPEAGVGPPDPRDPAREQREAMRAGAAAPVSATRAATSASAFIGTYPLATQFTTASVADTRAHVHGGVEGTLRVESVVDDLWVGTATMALPAVNLAGETEPRSVQIAAAFRARPYSAEAAGTCASPTTGR